MSYFLTEIPGTREVRVVNPAGAIPPDGSAMLVLGTDVPGFVRRLNPGDAVSAEQTASVGDAKILRSRVKIRGSKAAPPAVTANLEPFVLANGNTLTLRIDGGPVQTITFATGSFDDITQALSEEVRDAINAQLVDGIARVTGDGAVEIRSNSTGRHARVQITGGTGNTALDFEEWAWFLRFYVGAAVHFQVEVRPGEERDLTDVGVSLRAGGSLNAKMALELDTK